MQDNSTTGQTTHSGPSTLKNEALMIPNADMIRGEVSKVATALATLTAALDQGALVTPPDTSGEEAYKEMLGQANKAMQTLSRLLGVIGTTPIARLLPGVSILLMIGNDFTLQSNTLSGIEAKQQDQIRRNVLLAAATIFHFRHGGEAWVNEMVAAARARQAQFQDFSIDGMEQTFDAMSRQAEENAIRRDMGDKVPSHDFFIAPESSKGRLRN